MEKESETMARIKAKARTGRCRSRAFIVWQKHGKSEDAMLAILAHLLETIEKLENGEK